jgi:hypothetical protein
VILYVGYGLQDRLAFKAMGLHNLQPAAAASHGNSAAAAAAAAGSKHE